MNTTTKPYRNPWTWIPSLYLAEGFPYVLVMTVSVILYKNLGIGNAEIAFYTSWLYLPWVIKPFWSPMVDLVKTKRWWIYSMQLLLSVGLAGIAFSLPTNYFFQASLAFFYLMAFSSGSPSIVILRIVDEDPFANTISRRSRKKLSITMKSVLP